MLLGLWTLLIALLVASSVTATDALWRSGKRVWSVLPALHLVVVVFLARASWPPSPTWTPPLGEESARGLSVMPTLAAVSLLFAVAWWARHAHEDGS